MTSILACGGPTPLIDLAKLTEPEHARISLKLERFNPGGSIKDRPAKYIIEMAEERGLLKPGGTIIESSSGNFGIACAMIGAVKGYRVIILIDPKTTTTNRALMHAYGAETVVVTQKDNTGSYHKTRIASAKKLAESLPQAFWPNQCFNLDNSEAHYRFSAPELFAQCDQKIDVLITSVSTGGQLGGFCRYFSEHSPETKIIAVDAMGSAVFGGRSHGYLVPGVGLGWTPKNITDLSKIHAVFQIKDELAFWTCRSLANNEGVLVGGSSGAAVFIGLHFSQILEANQRIVCIAPDSGERYLNTIYNDQWMREHGLATDCSIEMLRQYAADQQPCAGHPHQTNNFQTNIGEEIAQLAEAMDVEPVI